MDIIKPKTNAQFEGEMQKLKIEGYSADMQYGANLYSRMKYRVDRLKNWGFKVKVVMTPLNQPPAEYMIFKRPTGGF